MGKYTNNFKNNKGNDMRKAGPSKMRKGFMFNANGKRGWVVGFTGYKGFRYHPTKGFKKQSEYNPTQNVPAIPL